MKKKLLLPIFLIVVFVLSYNVNGYSDPVTPTNNLPSAQQNTAKEDLQSIVRKSTPSYVAGATTSTQSHISDYPTLSNDDNQNIENILNYNANINNNANSAPVTIKYDVNTPLNQQVVIISDFGAIVIKLNEKNAPISTKSFVKLIQSGYYKNTNFFRLYDHYFIQAGDPLDNGTGNVENVTFPKETKNDQIYRGTVALAMSDNTPSHNGSQFFISFVRAPWLDNKYTVIGTVVSGLEYLETFFGKYSTDLKYGIISTPIPYKIYLLSDFANQFKSNDIYSFVAIHSPENTDKSPTVPYNNTNNKAKTTTKRKGIDLIGTLLQPYEYVKGAPIVKPDPDKDPKFKDKNNIVNIINNINKKISNE